MTPKEKAKELVNKYQSGYKLGGFNFQFQNDDEDAKQCALIAVDEILDINSVDKDYELSNYWQEVKQEIENQTILSY
jgi:hypothetical protein